MKSTIVVGYDGSPAAERALVEAAHQAASRDLPLTIVNALAPDVPEAPIAASAVIDESRRRAAQELLTGAADLVRYRHPNVAVQTSAVVGGVPSVLADASREADLLVLGSRGLSRLEGMLLGSVSMRTLAEANCPVLVVHDQKSAPHGRVLAAVDIAEPGEEILDAAFAEASRRRVRLRVVHVWSEPWVYDEADTMDADAAVAMDMAGLRTRLEALVRPWQAKYPDVDAHTDVLKGADAGSVLAEASGSADLLVVGGRRHAGGRRGLKIGAVARPLLQYAACPVAVVPTD